MSGLDPVGGYIQAYVQGDSARKAQHEAQGRIYEGQEKGVSALNAGYGEADTQYSLLDGILNDAYGQAIDTTRGSFEKALSSSHGGYKAARKDVIVGYDEAGKAIYGSYGNARDEYNPWKESGTKANNIIADLSGANGPEAQKAAYASFQTSPDYQVRVDAANQALQRSAMAGGNLFSGNFAHAMQRQNQDMASSEYGNYYARLMGLSDRGLNAAGRVSDLYASEGNALASLYGNRGLRLADLSTGEGNASANLYAQLGSNVAGLQTDLGNARSTAIQNRATLAVNKGNALANIYTGNASQLANYGYLGEMNIGEAKRKAAANAGEQTQLLYQDALAGYKAYNSYGAQ